MTTQPPTPPGTASNQGGRGMIPPLGPGGIPAPTQYQKSFTGARKQINTELGILPSYGIRRWHIRRTPPPPPPLPARVSVSNLAPGLIGQFGHNWSALGPLREHEHQAECLRGKTFAENACSGLDLDCTCGFYAYWSVDVDIQYRSLSRDTIVGIIAGYGTIVEGTRGFRCEKAKIVALATCITEKQEADSRDRLQNVNSSERITLGPDGDHDQLVALLAKWHPGVPVFRDIPTMLAEFPLSDPPPSLVEDGTTQLVPPPSARYAASLLDALLAILRRLR